MAIVARRPAKASLSQSENQQELRGVRSCGAAKNCWLNSHTSCQKRRRVHSSVPPRFWFEPGEAAVFIAVLIYKA